MKPTRLLRIVAPLCVILAAPRLPTSSDVAVGVLLNVGPDAQSSTGEDETLKPAHKGDLLTQGSRLFTGGVAASFLYYPDRSSYIYVPDSRASFPAVRFETIERVNTQFEVRFIGNRPLAQRGSITNQKRWSVPIVLPRPARMPRPDSQMQSDAADLAAIEAALTKEPSTPILRLSKAALLERMNRLPEALGEYRALTSEWSQTRWLKDKLPELGRDIQTAERKALLAKRGPAAYAVLIGISDYQRLPSFDYADQDLILFERHLESPRGGRLPKENIFALVNKRATVAEIHNTLRTVLETKAGPQDTVYVFVAAHGLAEPVGVSQQGFLMSYDGDADEQRATAYPLTELAQLLRKNLPRLKRVFVFADLCRLGRFHGAPNEVDSRIRAQFEGLNGEYEVMLSSSMSQGSQAMTDQAGSHGVFSRFLVAGLQGEADSDSNQDGQVSGEELFQYVSRSVSKATGGNQQPVRFGTVPQALPLSNLTASGIRTASGGRPQEYPVYLASLGGLWRGPLRMSFQVVSKARQQQRESFSQALPQSVALEDDGQQIILRYLRGDEAPMEKEAFERGARLFREAHRLNPSPRLEARSLFCEGRLATFNKRFANAAAALEEALRIDPEAAYSYNALGIAYLEQAEYRRAAWAFRDAIRRAPHWVYPHHNLALTYTEAGAYGAAEREYRAAIELAPTYSNLHYNLGQLLHRLNRKIEAEEEYLEALKLDPGKAEAYTGLGVLRAGEGKEEDAERLYQQALRLKPDLLPARHDLGLLYEQQERYQEAADQWRENLRRDPEFTPSLLSLARLYRRLKDYQQAARQYEALLRFRGNYIPARVALNETLGDSYASTGESAKAAESYRAALDLATQASDRRRLSRKVERVTTNQK